MHDSLPTLQTALAERYRLQHELGRGGMATVYLSEDVKHHRHVAIKVLRPELAAALGPERFLREITVTAKLDHPHILPLLDSGEAAGFLYYVMPYVEGETLRDRLTREKQLPLDDALAITREVANALGYAHSRGIVHRDIKPENILLAGGHARVADFGIARVVAEAAGERLTVTGIAVGTPAYMSPEQVAGEQDVDGRSDLYSLGCVLYEMLAGEPPYVGASAQAILAKRLSEPAPRVSVLRETVPARVEAALSRALARTPADRFATASEFVAGLTQADAEFSRAPWASTHRRYRVLAGIAAATVGALALGTWGWGPTRRSAAAALNSNVVAVAPFRVTASDSAYNYLREGGVDLLNAHLTGDGVPRAVDSRTTLSRWRRAVEAEGGDLTTAQALRLAAGLSAGRLFLGELLVTPSRMRLTGRLLRVPDGAVVAEHTETGRPGEADEVLLVERLLGRLVAAAGHEHAAGRLGPLSDSLAAVKAYLAGRQAHRRGEYAQAMAAYRRALAIDSTFAMAAYHNYFASWWRGSVEPVVETARAAWLVRDRLSSQDVSLLVSSIGPNYPGPSTWSERIAAVERAVHLNPDRPEALGTLGAYLLIFGPQIGAPGWFARATIALDSALVLDSALAAPVAMRLYAALLRYDSLEIRRTAALHSRVAESAELAPVLRWLVARRLGDFEGVEDVRARLVVSPPIILEQLADFSLLLGVSLAPVDSLLQARLDRTGLSDADRCTLVLAQVRIASARGRVHRLNALAESASALPACAPHSHTITLGLIDSAYAPIARRYGEDIARSAEDSPNRTNLCFAALWRVAHGDTVRARGAAERILRLAREEEPPGSPPIGVGRLGLCARMIEAGVEAWSGSGGTPALHRADSLHRQGTGWESPSGAHVTLASMLEQRGDLGGALAAVRRRPLGWNPMLALVLTPSLREEGRLAALAGDTAGAIRAYQHYLTLRDQPDPGPMGEEVSRVRTHLAALVREQGLR